MQKIKDILIKKIYKYNLSRIEIITLLDFINFADEKGKVQVYYKDMVELVGCSNAQFYNILNDLENLGLIRRVKNTTYKNEMEITLIENDFTSGYERYVDTNKVFFTNRVYASMGAGETRTYLYFLFRACKQKYNIINDKNKLWYRRNTYKTIAAEIGITMRMAKQYCKELDTRSLVCVGNEIDAKGKKYDIITLNKAETREPVIIVTEKGKNEEVKAKPLHMHWCHFIKVLCRRHKKTYDALNLNNTALLFNQYARAAKEQGKDIYGIITNAILNLKECALDSKAMHYITRALIGLDYTASIIVY